jgi:hypothetical protein
MNQRTVLLLSLGLNGVLFLACWQLWTQPKPRVTSPPARPAPLARAPAPLSDLNPVAPAENGPAAVATVHWSEVASSDFFVYRDNLRAIGCPENTVRDILESEISQAFLERQQPILDSIEARFWDRAAERGQAAFDDEKEQLLELLGERTELLNAVLGPRASFSPAEDVQRRAFLALRCQGLPEELFSQLLALEEQRWEADDELVRKIRSRADPSPTPEEIARRNQRLAEHDANRRALLGDWADELALRNSRYAQWHLSLPGFEPTEAEWRAVAKAGWELETVRGQGGELAEFLVIERYGLAPERSAEELEAIAEAEARYEASLRSTLGQERYAEYQHKDDRDYRQTRLVTQRLGLEDDVAVQAWNIQRAAQAAADQLRAAQGMDDARRQAALQDINAETVHALRNALGDRGYGVYQEYVGAWLQTLSEER